MVINATVVFEKTWDAITGDKRFIIHQGGSRSSKTYSICQAIIIYALKNPRSVVSIIRKTFPALRATVYRDFIEILNDLGIYSESAHSKSENTYKFPNGSFVEFFSADDQQKLRGRKRDLAFCNEANELTEEDFNQINLRTSDKIILDYNPSMLDSWIYRIPEERSILIKSTYKDNPFLGEAIKEEIENYRFTDPEYYTIFALGERVHSRENIYTKWEMTERPEHLTESIYAIDFGYTHPTALVRIFYHPNHNEVWIEELIYETHLTSQDLIDKMESIGVDKTRTMVVEVARPEIVADMKRAGFKCVPAQKDVRGGILVVKGFKVSISPSSKNIEKENMNYRYKKSPSGQLMEEPIKLYDDAMDAIRYGIMWIKKYGLKVNNPKSNVYSFNL